ncbi:uncharacterized protein LOC125837407 [Solanum verrucosum]|uniref:uncharacterized protein LOC125837407 n=1 Tax=Solanum verrucosum TaxID=315347 RepID=UPI0020D15982|nr:uncharacterized protein LOC125837407 [Solanum verrucosum]
MPLSLYLKLGLGSPKRTIVILQLADRSIAKPEGVVEDVLVQVGSLIFPVDFVVLDFEPDIKVSFILGRPFLSTGRALIDVATGQLTMRAHDKVKVFDVYRALKLPSIYEELSAITVVDQIVESQVVVPEDPLERVLVGHEMDGETEAQEIETCLNLALVETHNRRVESLDRELGPPPKPSIEEAPNLELKTLPTHLRYAFLGTNETLPVILFAELSKIQVDAALRILKRRKKAIGWQMADIHGISLALCIHRIYMEEDHKSSAQHQRRLNPLMKEVVRKEVIKWLDAGIVYPISDSKWDFTGDSSKIFSKIARPMCSLLEKEVKFDFDEMCLKAFEMLKRNLIEAPILIAPNWELPFELIKTLDSAQANYTVTEKEMLALMFAFDKFRSYLIGTKVIVFIDHATIRYLFNKKGAKPRLIRWILLLQEFDLKIKDRKGTENQLTDHLSRLEDFSHVNEGDQIWEEFSDEQLMALDISQVTWYADIVNLIVSGEYPLGATTQKKKKLNHNAKFYVWNEPFLFKQGVDRLMRRCIPEYEVQKVLGSCHASPYGGHHGGERTAHKVLQSGFFWPSLFKYFIAFVKGCDKFQRLGTILRRHEMPLSNILEVEIFDVWGIDFMGPFPPSSGNQYILVVVDYVSKWVDAVALPSNDSRVVIKFIKKHIFTRFGTPRAIISDGGKHFINNLVKNLLSKYGIRHKVATAYHPQTSGQVEVSNRTAYKIPIGTSPYHIVFGKTCHLPAELEHQAYWTIKRLNLDPELIDKKRVNQLHELEDFRLHAYDNAKLYKEKTKRWHDKHIFARTFTPGENVTKAPKAKNVAGSKQSRKSEAFGFGNREPVRKFGKKVVERYGWEWFECQREPKYMGDEYIHEDKPPYRDIQHTFCGVESTARWERSKDTGGEILRQNMMKFRNNMRQRFCYGGLITRFLRAQGIDEEAVDLTIAFHPNMVGKLIDMTRTKALDTSHGPILSAQERQACDDNVMARMFSMVELQLQIGGYLVIDDEMETMGERYPLIESVAFLCKTSPAFLEPMDDDEASADEAMDDEEEDVVDDKATALMVFDRGDDKA